MPNYRRPNVSGGTYFITQVTYQREPWLCSETGGVTRRVKSIVWQGLQP
ncbi:MAG: hypothetical protein ACKPER_20710 [Dolichospermum sp.]